MSGHSFAVPLLKGPPPRKAEGVTKAVAPAAGKIEWAGKAVVTTAASVGKASTAFGAAIPLTGSVLQVSPVGSSDSYTSGCSDTEPAVEPSAAPGHESAGTSSKAASAVAPGEAKSVAPAARPPLVGRVAVKNIRCPSSVSGSSPAEESSSGSESPENTASEDESVASAAEGSHGRQQARRLQAATAALGGRRRRRSSSSSDSRGRSRTPRRSSSAPGVRLCSNSGESCCDWSQDESPRSAGSVEAQAAEAVAPAAASSSAEPVAPAAAVAAATLTPWKQLTHRQKRQGMKAVENLRLEKLTAHEKVSLRLKAFNLANAALGKKWQSPPAPPPPPKRG